MQTRIDGVGIRHIAAAVPKTEVSTMEYVKCRDVENLKRVIKKTGITSIRVTQPGQTTADLCQAAAEKIFADGYDKGNICAIIFVSKTPDHIVNPPTSCLLQHRMGFGEEVLCYDSMAACYGFIGGLQLATLLVKQFGKDVLLLTGDTNSKLVNQKDSAAVMFGDGGAAAIIGVQDNFIDMHIRHNGGKSAVYSVRDGGGRHPFDEHSLDLTEDKYGNLRNRCQGEMHGLDMTNFVINDAGRLVKETIEKYGGVEKFDLCMLHQPNEMIVKSLMFTLDISEEKVPMFVNGHGNVSSACIPMGLCITAERGALPEGEHLLTLMAGYGGGASWGTAVTDLKNTRFHGVVEV